MATAILPPNPCLIAVILMIKTGSGVHHVFHYPPRPGKERTHIRLDYENESEETSSSSSNDENYSSLDDEAAYGHTNSYGEVVSGSLDMDESGSASPEKLSQESWKESVASTRKDFLGLPAGVKHFLCPPPAFHKKRFEMTIDGLVFLGWPVFANEHGEWKRRKKTRRKSSRESRDTAKMATIVEGEPIGSAAERLHSTDAVLEETTEEDTAVEDTQDTNETVDSTPKPADGPLPAVTTTEAESRPKQGLQMFHVVFVMKPPPLEYHVRVEDMYRHVVKKFSRALKYHQARTDFVHNECDKIRAMGAANRVDSSLVIQKSILAAALQTLYVQISSSRIAHITLSSHLSFSLQIPIPTSISTLPTPTEPQVPGLWLTTALPSRISSDVSNGRTTSAAHFALLLLSDLPSILAELAASPSPLSAPLTHYLQHTTPTKSFYQISVSSGISLPDIQFLASHLIYWRRARAIPPIHGRDIYIVSPNADMSRLKSASIQYSKLFPALPSLPKVLTLLSGSRGPYRMLFPSKDHKHAYLEILAWLLRGGWVTQLRHFAWVRVPGHIRGKVLLEVDIEQKRAKQQAQAAGEPYDDFFGESAPAVTEAWAATPSGNDVSDADASSVSSHSTAIPLFHPSLTATTAPAAAHAAVLILQPTKASLLEGKFLAAIAEEIERREGEEVRREWQVCLRYFTGEHALEEIAVRDGWKRKKVEGLRALWIALGILCVVRHW